MEENIRPRYPILITILRYGMVSIIILLLAAFVCCQVMAAPEEEETLFLGQGTREDPYRISGVEDLARLAESVNSGVSYAGCYFEQIQDLDFDGYENWTPIGLFGSGCLFEGFYDGGGYAIRNISIDGNQFESGNVGLFGQLAGVVYNLGIESGEITGACVGSIASHAGSSDAMIINCYSKATLTGGRCGGIADNFGAGKLICCWSAAELNGIDATGSITSYSAETVFGCFGWGELISTYFSGTMRQSEIREEIDFDEINQEIDCALYEFDLQNLDIKKWPQ